MANKNPLCLWTAIETDPNRPSPRCFIIEKSFNFGGIIVYLLISLRVINLAEPSQELVELPNFVEA
jgi:hypothetical protein